MVVTLFFMRPRQGHIMGGCPSNHRGKPLCYVIWPCWGLNPTHTAHPNWRYTTYNIPVIYNGRYTSPSRSSTSFVCSTYGVLRYWPNFLMSLLYRRRILRLIITFPKSSTNYFIHISAIPKYNISVYISARNAYFNKIFHVSHAAKVRKKYSKRTILPKINF